MKSIEFGAHGSGQPTGFSTLYLHIPFCAAKCRYCDFYSVRYDAEAAVSYLGAIEKEIDLCRENGSIDDRVELETVFFGGGTPSTLSAAELTALCRVIRDSFTLAPGYEWTVECNPESFTPDKAAALREGGVTRLTFGFQSLNDRELRMLGRIHSADRCHILLVDESLTPFTSIGVDLMYGLPGQSFEALAETLDVIFTSSRVMHLSAYELTIAEETPFGRHHRLLSLPVEKEMSRMTEGLWRLLKTNGFEQYEVSNFAKEGHRCRHNEAYWDHRPWLGLGCAAHSYLDGQRFANIADLGSYLAMVADRRLPRDFIEEIDVPKQATEMVLLGLRRVKGIDTTTFLEKCGLSFEEFVNTKKMAEFIEEELLTFEPPFLRPTMRGLLVADAMAAALI